MNSSLGLNRPYKKGRPGPYELTPVKVMNVVRDVIEPKPVEEEWIRLSSAVRMSSDSMVLTDLEAKITDVNEATLQMYGTDDKGDLIGKSAFDLIAPEDQEKAFAGMAEVLEEGHIKNREYHVITKDGRKILVEMSVAVIKDGEGKPLGFVGISRDITERKRMEEALRQKEERLEAILDAVSDAIVALDLQGVITSANRAAEIIFQYSKEEFIGKPLELFVTPESAALARARTEKALRKESLPPIFELEALRKDGVRVPLETKARFLYKKGKPVELVCVLRDITCKKELERQKADFLAMLTHDIRNPLSVILGYAGMLQEMGGLSPEQEGIIKRQEMSAQMALSLVNNYLDFCKIEAGHPTPAKKSLRLNNLGSYK